MGSSDQRQAALGRRILLARTALLETAGFYGLLLMHMGLKLSDRLPTAWTDGKSIYFNPEFADGLSDDELAFVMQHEVLHVALRHLSRGKELPDRERQNKAADIVVNSNILESNGGDLSSITLREFGESMHLAPDGKEGRCYTMEEVYLMLGAEGWDDGAQVPGDSQVGEASEDEPDDGKGEGDASEDEQGGQGENNQGDPSSSPSGPLEAGATCAPGGWDWHVQEDGEGDDWEQDTTWKERVKAAAEAEVTRNDGDTTFGTVPAGVRRLLEELHDPRMDWRTLLAGFVQEEICDYSFAPPDRRFSGDLLLPAFNDTEAAVRDVLFLVDTSGSVSDDAIRDVFSELAGAVAQFDGRMDGWISFFDAEATAPERFEDAEELLDHKPVGGGGTSFRAAFQVLGELDDIDAVTAIVVLTDGYAPYPRESIARGIPTLWVVNNGIATPPWGKVARLDETQ